MFPCIREIWATIEKFQNDVLGLIDSTGTEVVKYTYDAWGKVLSTTGSLAATLGTIQPFRYRGYVYDVETGQYYLRSRYYSSIWYRFVNADTFIKGNLFGYCENSPICMLDDDGFISSFALRVIIHNLVCWHICKSYPGIYFRRFGMKVNYNEQIDGKTYGFIDILDLSSGEAYEVKRKGLSIDAAVVQLTHYVHGTLSGLGILLGEEAVIPDIELSPGTNTLIKGEFNFLGYTITYQYERDGIITYDYYEQPDFQLVSESVPNRREQKQRDLAESKPWGKILVYGLFIVAAGGTTGAMFARLENNGIKQ